MRQKRAKSYRKQMNVYHHAFKFREPYQTLVDAALVLQAHKTSFDLVKGLNRTIQGEVKPMITQCCMQELYLTNNQEAIDSAKRFERRRCNHPPSNPIPSSDCIKSVVDVNGENKHRYIIATQDEELRRHMRKVPGVPLVYMNRAVMVMEPLSKASANVQNMVENRKLTLGLNDPKLAGIPKDVKEGDTEGSEKPQLKKRKGPKGPNPLSVKKKKTTTTDADSKNEQTNQQQQQKDSEEGGNEKKRRRRHHGGSKDKTEDEDKNDEGKHDEEEGEIGQEIASSA